MASDVCNRNIPTELHNKLLELAVEGIKCLAFTPVGGWVIFHENDFFARNIPDEAFDVMRKYNKTPRQVHHFAFAPNGWIALADDKFFARNIDYELFDRLRPLRAARRQVDLVVFDPDGRGWSCTIGEQSAIRQIKENSGSGTSLWDEIMHRNVLGVCIALVENNALSWSKGYGHLREDHPARERTDTIFQVASVSKPLVANELLRLVQTGIINLDDNLSTHLRGWNLSVAEGTTTTVNTTI